MGGNGREGLVRGRGGIEALRSVVVVVVVVVVVLPLLSSTDISLFS